MQDAVTARVPDFDFSQFTFETHGMTYLHPQNDITVTSGFLYDFWIYYQDYLLDPEHYELLSISLRNDSERKDHVYSIETPSLFLNEGFTYDKLSDADKERYEDDFGDECRGKGRSQ